MRRLIFTLFVFTIFLSTGFQFGDGIIQKQNNNIAYIPDVLGRVNILDKDGKTFIAHTDNPDSFPMYSGYPVSITSANTNEGGIFCNMDGDPELEILYNTGLSTQARNLDGSSVPGWPKIYSQSADGAPSYGDIDGDGQGEIVVAVRGATISSGGSIQAFELNGSPVTGFPINHGFCWRSPVLADLDNNGSMEIIVPKRTASGSEMYVYKGDGTIFPGWPKPLLGSPASSAAVGNIDNSPGLEIVMESSNTLQIWHANGDSLAGFSFTLPNGDNFSYSSPVLVDVNGDNTKEIIIGSHGGSGGYVYIVNTSGTILPNWPKTTAQWVFSAPAVGYIDNDNILDIAVGDEVSSGTPADFVYAWNVNGTALSGFPIGPLNAINGQITLADVDNDNMTELIFDDNTWGPGRYLGYNHDGTPMSGWPIEITGASFFSTVILTDLNRDGMLDIAGTGNVITSQTVYMYLWNTGTPYNTSRMFNPVWQYNVQHTGEYGDRTLVNVNMVSNQTPESFKLHQNYPNPFNPSTNIKFDITKSSNVRLTVYDMLGKEVKTLFTGDLNAGSYEYNFNAEGLTSGVYFYRLFANGETIGVNKMLLIK
ncbi:MAG: T9SS type A sorting domain-containing protein [Ignavibacteriae bacterium]|nr:T9SS type A sorting domain-containing protein [Ignavibacteriota bacterium]